MTTWYCMQGCGACCNLTPGDRPDLADYLTPAELEQYLSMVGEDGWCIHYDSDSRRCTIYEERPRFCRVRPDTFADMFGIEAEDFTEFAIACCQQQIEGVYGPRSQELAAYEQGLDPEDTGN